MTALQRLRAGVAPLSPGHRRWVRFLRSLPLDPDALSPHPPPPGPHDFIMCGCPRTGTTLLSAALYQPPRVLTVMEPWDGMRLPPDQLFASLRAEVDAGDRLTRGRLDIGSLLADGAVRWCTEGSSTEEVAMDGDWLLGVKWPGYWRFLDRLPSTRFIVTLRHPYEVIASFKALGGRVGQGLQYDTTFNRDLNRELTAATRDERLRRVLLFDYIHERVIPHLDRPNVLVVRYERWFDDPDELLAEIGAFLGVELREPPVRIRAASTVALPADERELVRTTSTTAGSLGYDLS